MERADFAKHFGSEGGVSRRYMEITPDAELFEALRRTNPYAPFLIDTFLTFADEEAIRATGWYTGSNPYQSKFYIEAPLSGQEENNVARIEGNLTDRLTLTFQIPSRQVTNTPGEMIRASEKIKLESDKGNLTVTLSLGKESGPYDAAFNQWMLGKFVPEYLSKKLPLKPQPA